MKRKVVYLTGFSKSWQLETMISVVGSYARSRTENWNNFTTYLSLSWKRETYNSVRRY